MLAEVKDRGCEHGIRAGMQAVGEMLQLTNAARCDHRHGGGASNGIEQRTIVAGAGAIAVTPRDASDTRSWADAGLVATVALCLRSTIGGFASGNMRWC